MVKVDKKFGVNEHNVHFLQSHPNIVCINKVKPRAPLEQVPRVLGNLSILAEAKQKSKILRKPSLNVDISQKMQSSGTRQFKFLTEPWVLR